MKKRASKPTLSVVLSQELYDKAQRIADSDDRSMASLIRKLLEQAQEPQRRAS